MSNWYCQCTHRNHLDENHIRCGRSFPSLQDGQPRICGKCAAGGHGPVRNKFPAEDYDRITSTPIMHISPEEVALMHDREARFGSVPNVVHPDELPDLPPGEYVAQGKAADELNRQNIAQALAERFSPPSRRERQVASLRARSGLVRSRDPLVKFLYLLMRGEVVPGRVAALVNKADSLDEALFTNGWLAQYAIDCANRLKRTR